MPKRTGTIQRNKSEDEVEKILHWYNKDTLEILDGKDSLRRHDLLVEWYEWCDRRYTGAKSSDWKDIISAAGRDVDIRVLLMGHPIATYSILLFLEACYEVDKALCGTNVMALETVKKWHMPLEMRAYKYILSEEMLWWWAARLSELENEIRSSVSNQVSLTWRLRDLHKCLAKLEEVMELGRGIGSNIWTTMIEDGYILPNGVVGAIYDRVASLKVSMKILGRALKESQSRSMVLNAAPLSTDLRSIQPDGIRRRLSHPISSKDNEHFRAATKSSIVDKTDNRTRNNLPESTLSKFNLQYLYSTFEHMTRYKNNGDLALFIHKKTITIVIFCFIATSVFLTTWSASLASSEPRTSERELLLSHDFLEKLSQVMLSSLSTYLATITAVHNGSLWLRYRSWFWVCQCVSILLSLLVLSFYPKMSLVSTGLLWGVAFAQAVILILFIIKPEDGTELHEE